MIQLLNDELIRDINQTSFHLMQYLVAIVPVEWFDCVKRVNHMIPASASHIAYQTSDRYVVMYIV